MNPVCKVSRENTKASTGCNITDPMPGSVPDIFPFVKSISTQHQFTILFRNNFTLHRSPMTGIAADKIIHTRSLYRKFYLIRLLSRRDLVCAMIDELNETGIYRSLAPCAPPLQIGDVCTGI